MIRVGCCGWPVSQSRYRQRLSAAEISSSFENPPRLSTAQRWRADASPDFVYSVRAWRLITHPSSSPTYERRSCGLSKNALARCGLFKPSDEVLSAWRKTQETALALQARFVVFQTPAAFYPNADHLRDMYRFFKGIRREGMSLVWEPRGGGWEPALIRKVCRDLSLIHGVDPLAAEPQNGAVGYFRLSGRRSGDDVDFSRDYSDAELRDLLARCGEKTAYVFFNNAGMWQDALRFEAMAHPVAGRSQPARYGEFQEDAPSREQAKLRGRA